MKRNILATINLWLSNKKTNIAWLPIFRICLSVFCLLHFLALLPDIKLFLSVGAIIPPDILQARASTAVPSLYTISRLLGNQSVTDNVIYIFSGLYLLSLLALAVGLLSRASAIAATLLHLVLMNSMTYYIYGIDCFCGVALFYCTIFPVGYFMSIDKKIFKKRKLNISFLNYCLLILQIHICIAYFFGGIDKLSGINWWNGESIWKVIHLIDSPKYINLDFLAKTHIFQVAGWGVFLIELLYPLFINIRKTRKLWLILVVSMHLLIALFLGLFFFAAFMIILNVCVYYIPYSEKEVQLSVSLNNETDDHSLRLQM